MEPDHYMGASISKFKFEDGTVAWYQSSDECIKNDAQIVDENLDAAGEATFPMKTNTIIPEKYDLKLDISPECDDYAANFYHNLMGILRWSME